MGISSKISKHIQNISRLLRILCPKLSRIGIAHHLVVLLYGVHCNSCSPYRSLIHGPAQAAPTTCLTPSPLIELCTRNQHQGVVIYAELGNQWLIEPYEMMINAFLLMALAMGCRDIDADVHQQQNMRIYADPYYNNACFQMWKSNTWLWVKTLNL